MEFRILGPLEVVDGGAVLPLGGAKQRALLTVLLLNANRVVSTDGLIDQVWGESPPETAPHVVQVYVSQLRKALGRERLVTRSPGYSAQLDPGELDLTRFESLLAEGRDALAAGDAGAAARSLREALGLWRGQALAEFAFEPFAQNAIGRLEELRLVALEERIEADVALGRHAAVVGELEEVIRGYPLRERPRAQLMLALYRSGRQAEALEAYQDARRVLVEELGIDPSPALQRLEKAILNQDPELDTPAPGARRASARAQTPSRSILVVPRGDEEFEALLAVGRALARSRSPHELVLAQLASPDELGEALRAVQARRAALQDDGVTARATAFTTDAWEEDVARLAQQQDVDLLLVDERAPEIAERLQAGPLRTVLEDAPPDVALLAAGEPGTAGPVFVPFGGGEHEWGALELGAWLASALDVPLRLLGTEADESEGRRDASRLLASAALAVQQLAGVLTEPVLVPAGAESMVEACRDGGWLVVGLSPRWRQEGLGAPRAKLVADAPVPTLLLRRGVRPGGLSPQAGLTRFTWSLESGVSR
ncbi:MAG: BTAD domain-containing putative transcriptional regulator [Gaiellaceae bacterium]